MYGVPKEYILRACGSGLLLHVEGSYFRKSLDVLRMYHACIFLTFAGNDPWLGSSTVSNSDACFCLAVSSFVLP